MDTLNVNVENGVCVVELNRPDALNALNGQMTDDLADVFIDKASDESVKVLLLTGAGRAFWAGADLKEMGQTAHKPKHGFTVMLESIIDFPKPFLVAVNGIGVGIGATICGLADIVYMSESARLRCPFSTLGLTAEAASTVTFPELLGHQRASWFLLSSEWMNATECRGAGLALEVLPPEELMSHAMEKAAVLATLPVASLVTTKSLLVDPVREQRKAAIVAENQGLARLQGGPANREALKAFREKRDPDFSNL